MAPHPAEPLERAVAEGVFPAAALVASRGGGEPLAVYAGEAGPDTRFDLASLTKVLYTTAAAMVLVSDGRLDPEAPAEKLLPEWALGATVRVRHLLHHESGLPWWRPLYEEVGAPGDGPRDAALRRAMLRAALALPPEAEPEARAEYSDPGFIVLEQVCERAAGGPLPALVAERVWVPLGLRTTGFVDLTVPGAREAARAEAPHAPTEDCPWRGRRLVAEVHDHNAHALGGVAGHAGLFGTAWDVHAFGAGVLRALEGRGPLPGDVVARFCGERGRAPGTTRTLGWDTPTPGASSAGRHVGPAAVGHLGFTGTSLWVDPDAGVVVALLTNRVYNGLDDTRIRQVRPCVHEMVYETLGAAG